MSPTAESAEPAISSLSLEDATNILALPDFAVEPGSYWIDVTYDAHPTTRVRYAVPADGWQQWIGALKIQEAGRRYVGISITNAENLVSDGCHNHAPADPPVGRTVDDLAMALGTLAPFQVLEGPRDVTAYGYRGTYLRLTVPEMPVEFGSGTSYFVECTDGKLET